MYHMSMFIKQSCLTESRLNRIRMKKVSFNNIIIIKHILVHKHYSYFDKFTNIEGTTSRALCLVICHISFSCE